MGKDPLDMNQYKKVFGTCRIPGVKRDSLQYHPTSKHIVVVHNNHVSHIKLNYVFRWNNIIVFKIPSFLKSTYSVTITKL